MKRNAVLVIISLVFLTLILYCSKDPTESITKSLELKDFYGNWVAQDTQGIYLATIVLNLNSDGTFLLEPMDILKKKVKSNIIIPKTPISGQYNTNIELKTIRLTTQDTNGYYSFSFDSVLFAKDTFVFELRWIYGTNFMNSVAPDSVLWKFIRY